MKTTTATTVAEDASGIRRKIFGFSSEIGRLYCKSARRDEISFLCLRTITSMCIVAKVRKIMGRNSRTHFLTRVTANTVADALKCVTMTV